MSQFIYTLEFHDESRKERDRIMEIMDNVSWDKQIVIGHPEKTRWIIDEETISNLHLLVPSEVLRRIPSS
jgi:hypothetical protein